MVSVFFNQEAEYEAFLSGGPGFVCNNLGFLPRDHRVHRSECSMLNRAGRAKYGMHTSVKKACSQDLQELVEWIEGRYGGEGKGYAYCAFCFEQRTN